MDQCCCQRKLDCLPILSQVWPFIDRTMDRRKRNMIKTRMGALFEHLDRAQQQLNAMDRRKEMIRKLTNHYTRAKHLVDKLVDFFLNEMENYPLGNAEKKLFLCLECEQERLNEFLKFGEDKMENNSEEVHANDWNGSFQDVHDERNSDENESVYEVPIPKRKKRIERQSQSDESEKSYVNEKKRGNRCGPPKKKRKLRNNKDHQRTSKKSKSRHSK